MRTRPLAAALLALGLATPLPAQEPTPPDIALVLGAPQVLEAHRVEFRVPTEFVTSTEAKQPHNLESWNWSVSGVRVASVSLVQLLDDSVETSRYVDGIQKEQAARGLRLEREARRPDPVLGTVAQLHLRSESGEEKHYYFIERGGRRLVLEAGCTQRRAPSLARILGPMVLSLRATSPADVRIVPPDDPEPREVAGLKVIAPKAGLGKAALDGIGRDLAAGMAFAAALTGGPATVTPPTIHIHAKPAVLQAIVPSKDKETPTALYLPAGRRLLAHAAATSRPGKGAPDRYEAALLAYLDAYTGTYAGRWAWLRTGLVEAAQCAAPEGDALVPTFAKSPLATWVKRNAAKTEWPDLATFVRQADRLEGERDRAYALALVLAARAAPDGPLEGCLSRYFATLKDTLDPTLALERALEGVDCAAWDAAARALLR